MKVRPIIQILLAFAIVGLAWLLYSSIMKPLNFENEFIKRRDVCAEKLKSIRTLEEAYKKTYGCYTSDFDTLFNRLLNEDSMRVISKQIIREAIPADVDINEVPENEAVKKGYIKRVEIFVNPVEKLRQDSALMITDAQTGRPRILTDQEIRDLRYVPYPKGSKEEFELYASKLDKSGFQVPVFLCQVSFDVLLKDLQDKYGDLIMRKKADLDERTKANPSNPQYAGWKVGDTLQAVTDGNFE